MKNTKVENKKKNSKKLEKIRKWSSSLKENNVKNYEWKNVEVKVMIMRKRQHIGNKKVNEQNIEKE